MQICNSYESVQLLRSYKIILGLCVRKLKVLIMINICPYISYSSDVRKRIIRRVYFAVETRTKYYSHADAKLYLKYLYILSFFLLAQQPPVGQGLLKHEVSRSHSDTPHSVGLPWTSDQLVAETCT